MAPQASPPWEPLELELAQELVEPPELLVAHAIKESAPVFDGSLG